MRVLVLGATGMLGHKIVQTFRSRFDTWATARSRHPFPEGCKLLEDDRILCGVDVSRFDSVIRAFADVNPDAVINCIGIVKQLQAAKDPLISIEINSLLPHRLVQLCQAAGARLIHIATDCAFSGRKGMYRESDASDAEDLYGRTKFLGEVAAPGCLTMRTSIIGRELDTRNGLVEWFLSSKGGRVRGFRRAIFSGFPTHVLARIIAEVLENHRDLEGLYNVSAQPINKYDLLVLLNEAFNLGIEIESEGDFVCDRSLDSTRFRAVTGFQPPSWPEMVREMADDPTPYDTWK